MGKDTLKTMGASNRSLEKRSKLDYYGTDLRITRALLSVKQVSDLHFGNSHVNFVRKD